MNFNKIFLLTLIFALFLSISLVSACEDTNSSSNLTDLEKTSTEITFKINDTYYINESVDVDISLNDDKNNSISGVINLKLNNDDYTVNITEGKGNITFSNLSYGKYFLNFTYSGDDNYKKSFSQANFSVKKYPSKLTIDKVENIKTSDNVILNVTLDAMDRICDIYINGNFKQKVYLKKGLNLLNFSYFACGEYNITVFFPEDDYYEPSNASVLFNVSKSNAFFNLSCLNISSGSDELITIGVLPDNFNSEVILSINGINNTVLLKNMSNNFTISNLTPGLYNVSVIFPGNNRFYKSNASSSFIVSQSLSSLNVSIEKNDSEGIIYVNTNPTKCSGSITLYINNRNYSAKLSEGFAEFNVNFDVGTNYIYVLYEGDKFYSPSNWTAIIGEAQNPFFILNNLTVYEYNDFTYSVILCEENGMAMPNKNITVELLNQKYNISTNDKGIAILKLNLNKGNYSLRVFYENISAKSNIEVEAIDFNLSVSDINYLENEIIQIDFKRNITGNIYFNLSNNLNYTLPVNSTSIYLNISGLNAGNYTVEAYYFNKLFNSSHIVKSFQIKKLDVNIDFNISKMNFGETGYITLSLPQNISGNITLVVDSDEYSERIISNNIVFKFDNLSKGYHNLSVIYLGDINYNNYTFNTNFSVRSIKSNIKLSINDSFYNEDIKVTAEINSEARGFIVFSAGNFKYSSKINNGSAVWTFKGLDAGNYTLLAYYEGDDLFLNTSSQSNFTVKKANSTIKLYVKEAFLGENIRIYANLSSNATGYVTYSMKDYYSPRNKTIINSTSSWYISPLDHGEYEVRASYSGDYNYYPSNTSFILNITQHKTILKITINDGNDEDRLIVRTRLTSDNGIGVSGNITLTINSKQYNVVVKKGASSLILGTFPIGIYTYSAVYEGNENYTKSFDEGSFKISDSILNVNLNSNNVVKHYRGSEKLIISLSDINGRYMPNCNISVRLDGVEYTLTTDSEGLAYLDLNQKSGLYNVNVKFNGTKRYYSSEINVSVEILPTIQSINLTKLFGSDDFYYAVFTDFEGNALSNTSVTFTINNKNYSFKTALNGIARVNINLNIGSYTIIAVNPVTHESVKNTIRIFNYIEENKDIIAYYGAGEIYKVRILDDNAKPVLAGADVVFTVGGKKYHVKTDKKGYASYKFNLKAKSYIISAKYKNCTVKNRIIVKPVLYGQNLIVKKGYAFKFKAKLINTKGKALKGKKITFKFKGKKYAAKTNKNGYASIIVKLKLNKGKYKIKTKYLSSTISNFIKVM